MRRLEMSARACATDSNITYSFSFHFTFISNFFSTNISELILRKFLNSLLCWSLSGSFTLSPLFIPFIIFVFLAVFRLTFIFYSLLILCIFFVFSYSFQVNQYFFLYLSSIYCFLLSLIVSLLAGRMFYNFPLTG